MAKSKKVKASGLTLDVSSGAIQTEGGMMIAPVSAEWLTYSGDRARSTVDSVLGNNALQVKKYSTKHPEKVLYTRQHFAQTLTAKDIRETVKKANPGWSNKLVQCEVNKILRGEKSLRNMVGAAYIQQIMDKNFAINYANERAKSIQVSFTLVEDAPVVPVPAPVVKAIAAPLTKAELLAQLAQIEALEALEKIPAPAK